MAELTVTAFLTLDGIMQAPGAPKEDTAGAFRHGGWMVPYVDASTHSIMAEIFSRADAFLLGRVTYEIFAAHWPGVSDPQNPIATQLNSLPKHVVSHTPRWVSASWPNTFLVKDIHKEVYDLKSRYARELQIHGSADLIHTLLHLGVIDEFRLLISPVFLGTGKRLFKGAGAFAMTLKEARTTSTGVIYCAYRPSGTLKSGSVPWEEVVGSATPGMPRAWAWFCDRHRR